MKYNFFDHKFGRLSPVFNSKNKNKLWCRCDCGVIKEVYKSSLKSKHTKSCGCLRKDYCSKTKGLSTTKESFAYYSMLRRCYDSNYKYYNNYGGRGIFVCRRWRKSFLSFLKDMGERPSKKQSLDRIDNNGPYAPWNCRWATMKEQARNKRWNLSVSHNGMNKILMDWAEYYDKSYHSLYYWYRIKKLSFGEAIKKSK